MYILIKLIKKKESEKNLLFVFLYIHVPNILLVMFIVVLKGDFWFFVRLAQCTGKRDNAGHLEGSCKHCRYYMW